MECDNVDVEKGTQVSISCIVRETDGIIASWWIDDKQISTDAEYEVSIGRSLIPGKDERLSSNTWFVIN